MTMACPSHEQLHSLLEESLPENLRKDAERHIETCLMCQKWLENNVASPIRSVHLPEHSVPNEAMNRWMTTVITNKPDDSFLHQTLGHYRLDALIGSGGMGLVYRAWDESLERTVAVKILRTSLDPDSQNRFVREVQTVAKFTHENIIKVYAAVSSPNQPSYLVMECVDGMTLRQAASQDRGLPPERAVAIVMQIAEALIAAHAGGIVHRDVKPANVLIDQRTQRAKLADFGLARKCDTPLITRSGMIIGTPAYLAPEQIRDSSNASPLADQYGLGATLYEALTGVEPYRGTMELVIKQVLADDPIPPRRLNPSIPRDLNSICLKAMAKEPASRYGSISEMRDDLRRWQECRPVVAQPSGRLEQFIRWAKRNPTIAGLAAMLVIGGVTSFAALIGLWLNATANAKRANDRERDAIASAETARNERERANEDYRRAEQVVNRFYHQMYDGKTVAAPLSIESRVDLLRDAIQFYEDIAKRRPEEKPTIELATVYARKGALLNILKENAKAEESYRIAVSRFLDAERAGSLDVKTQREFAECYFYLGLLSSRLGDMKGTLENYQIAIKRMTPLTEKDPQASYFIAGSLGNLAYIFEARGDRNLSFETHQRALPIQKHAYKVNPNNGGALQDLIWTTLAVARLQPDPNESVKAYEAANPLIEEYAQKYKNDYSRSDVLCSYYHEYATALRRADRISDAAVASSKALKVVDVIVKYPPAFQYDWVQAGAWAEEGFIRWQLGEFDAAEKAWEQSLARYGNKELSLLNGLRYRTAIEIHERLASIAQKRGRNSDAERHLKQASKLRDQIRKQFPD